MWVLDGNLFIRGGGDPTLGAGDMDSLLALFVNSVREKGIKTIAGKVVADARVFDHSLAADTWMWEDLGNYYAAGCGWPEHQPKPVQNSSSKPGQWQAIPLISWVSSRGSPESFFPTRSQPEGRAPETTQPYMVASNTLFALSQGYASSESNRFLDQRIHSRSSALLCSCPESETGDNGDPGCWGGNHMQDFQKYRIRSESQSTGTIPSLWGRL